MAATILSMQELRTLRALLVMMIAPHGPALIRAGRGPMNSAEAGITLSPYLESRSCGLKRPQTDTEGRKEGSLAECLVEWVFAE